MRHGTKVVALVGGHLLRGADGTFRTSTFDDYDNPYGEFGDRIRSEAAALLYRQSPRDTSIMVLGGVTPLHKTVPEAPHLSAVIKGELIALGVPEEQIEEIDLDPACGTYQQLAHLARRVREVCVSVGIDELAILASLWQFPRMFAMIHFRDELAEVLLQDRPRVRYVAAEEIVTDDDPKRYAEIAAACRRSERLACLRGELKGAWMVAEGTYKFPTTFPNR
ncbi:MAG: hypothetical protein Q8R32_02345 [bacterium]|nr:hypothetical protein [bacterium]